MKHLIPFLLIATVLLGCQSNSKMDSGSDTTQKITEVPLGYTGPLDLEKLQLKENAPAVLKAYKVKTEAVTDTDVTILGLDRMKSRALEALQFGGTNLSGSDGELKNYAVFHFDENSK